MQNVFKKKNSICEKCSLNTHSICVLNGVFACSDLVNRKSKQKTVTVKFTIFGLNQLITLIDTIFS